MTARRRVHRFLQRRRSQLALPPRRRLRDVRHVRLERFRLPPEVERSVGRSLNVNGQLVGARPAGRVMVVDLDRVVNRAGFSYSQRGWHPYVAALRQHLADPDLEFADSVLAAFYDRFRPRSVHELLLGGRDVPPAVLATWPAVDRLIDLWSVTGADVAARSPPLAGGDELPHSQYRGPAEGSAGAMHLRRTIETYESLREHGYLPERFAAGFVTGFFLTAGDDYRFVVGHGNHRVAALSVLGQREVAVTLRPAHPPVVDRARLSRWTAGRGGLLEEHEPLAVHERFFADDSPERAAALSLR